MEGVVDIAVRSRDDAVWNGVGVWMHHREHTTTDTLHSSIIDPVLNQIGTLSYLCHGSLNRRFN